VYAVGDAWARKGMLNLAGCGKFSSDHTITKYAAEIWRAKPCPGR
jgi:starch phosphorylase